ncbi:hypothetical protein [Microcoleus sp. F10-B2]|uniref:hypothetical protein n=1 Tax=Microcoleus sp. F10-B2 TaxID=2818751 RepID=UPI002FD2538E
MRQKARNLILEGGEHLSFAAKLEIGVLRRGRRQEAGGRRKEEEGKRKKEGAKRSIFTNMRCSLEGAG